jgi:hypothetical protein
MRSVAVLLILMCGCQSDVARADGTNVVVTIYRQYPDGKCTSGYLAVDGTIIVYALERPWVDNLSNVSSVPAGKYKAHLRYDKDDHWRIQLDGVPGRTGVQIHIGNQPEESKGCILVGEKLGADLCSLQGSKKAYAKLKKAFYGSEREAAYDPRNITVEIKGDQKPSR